jgi:FkbM family methyltransferase
VIQPSGAAPSAADPTPPQGPREPDRTALFRALDRAEAKRAALEDAPRWTRWRSQPVKSFRALLSRLLSETGAEIGVRLFTDQGLKVVLPEVVATNLYRFGLWEYELTRVLLTRLHSGMVFVDVGAQYGYFSLLASYLVGHDGRVFAFEPTRRTFNLLRQNVAHEANVEVENVAVDNVRGTVRLLDFGPRLSLLNTVRGQAKLPDSMRLPADLRPIEHQVPALPLDEYFGPRGLRLDFVKIDAEAADHQVLEGMQGILGQQSPMVSIEAGDYEGIENAVPTAESIRFLGKLGYHCLEFRAGELVPHQPRETYDHGTLYFIKR